MFGWIVVGAASSPLVVMVGKELFEEFTHALFMRKYCESRKPRGPLGLGDNVVEGLELTEVEA